MSTGGFARVLEEAMGLNPQSIGPYAIARAVQERMAALGLTDEDGYLVLATSSAGELQELVEAVVVPETWFFRNPPAFVELVRDAVALAAVRESGAVLRVLSLPCSSGEEPYSMAMALLDTGFRPQSFHVDGFDISSRNIALAHGATYGKNSFRSEGLEFRDRHFDPTDHGWLVREKVREAVRFAQANVLAPDFLCGAEPYDVIFCRNLLVYFNPAAQDRAIGVVRRLLRPGGVLCVGPGEAGLMLRHGFAWSKVPLAFSFRKDAAPAAKVAPPMRLVERAEAVSAIARKRIALPRRAAASPPRPSGATPSATPADMLERAVRLADRGELQQARAAYAPDREHADERATHRGLGIDRGYEERARPERSQDRVAVARLHSAGNGFAGGIARAIMKIQRHQTASPRSGCRSLGRFATARAASIVITPRTARSLKCDSSVCMPALRPVTIVLRS